MAEKKSTLSRIFTLPAYAMGGVIAVFTLVGGCKESLKENSPGETDLGQFLRGAGHTITLEYFRGTDDEVGDRLYDGGKGIYERGKGISERVYERFSQDFESGASGSNQPSGVNQNGQTPPRVFLDPDKFKIEPDPPK